MSIIIPIKHVLSDKAYKTKFVIVFAVIVILSLFLMTFISLPGLFLGEILITESATLWNVVFLVVFSFLAATSVIMHIYKIRELKADLKGKSSIGFLGIFFGFFTSACAICYPLILTFLGIPTAFALLPFSGLEFQVLSICLLLLSIYLIAKNIENSGVCKK